LNSEKTKKDGKFGDFGTDEEPKERNPMLTKLKK